MMEKIDFSKRAFLARLTCSERTPRKKARPPRAIDEALFIQTCNGCGNCQSACEASVIEIKNGLAQLNMDYNDCTLCDACTLACSTEALSFKKPLQTAFRPRFLADCQNYLSQDCVICQIACPRRAIAIKKEELPKLNFAQCNGCGLCRKACYFDSIVLVYNSSSDDTSNSTGSLL